MIADVPDGWEAGLRDFTEHLPAHARRSRHRCSPETPSGSDGRRASASMTADEAINMSLSGPMLPRERA